MNLVRVEGRHISGIEITRWVPAISNHPREANVKPQSNVPTGHQQTRGAAHLGINAMLKGSGGAMDWPAECPEDAVTG